MRGARAHRLAAPWVTACTALAVSVGGCAAVLGIETFEERTAATGGDAGTGNVGGTTGGGGAGAGTTGGGGTAPVDLGHVWSVSFGDPDSSDTDQSAARILSVGEDVFVAGEFEGSLDITTDGPPLTSVDGIDGFVAKLIGPGTPDWARTMTGPSEQSCRGLARFQDSIVVAGQYDGDITIGTATDLSAQGMDAFVGAYSLAGDYRWVEPCSAPNVQKAMDVAVDPTSDDIVLVGSYTGLSTFQIDNHLLPPVSYYDAWVAKLDENRQADWAIGLGCSSTTDPLVQCADALSDVVVDTAGNVIAVGTVGGDATIDGNAVQSVGNGALVVKLRPHDGSVAWARAYGGAGSDEASAVAVDSDDNVLVAGHFTGRAYFGTDELTDTGESGGFVMKLGPDGSYRWSVHLGGSGHDSADALAVAPDGSVYVAGRYTDGMTAAGVQLDCEALTNVFLVRVSPLGDPNLALCFGDTGKHMITAIAVDADGAVLLTGTLNGSIDFGGGPLSDEDYVDGDEARDIFVARLAPEP